MNNIDDWNFPDPEPNVPLGQIPVVSTRATALIARNRNKPLLKTQLTRIFGAVEMVAGMEYHHDNFVSLCTPTPSPRDQAYLRHEAVAYLNRMGQFYKFARSEFVKAILPATSMPKFAKLIVFRHKYTAHRSIDAPRGDDSHDLQLAHARSLSQLFGNLFIPRDKSKPADIAKFTKVDDMRKHLWAASYLAFQIFDAQTNVHLNFCMETDHAELMVEAYPILEGLILHA